MPMDETELPVSARAEKNICETKVLAEFAGILGISH